MGVKIAVVTRIKELCTQRGITPNTLANLAGITPSTLYTMMNENRKDIGIITIKKICDGLNMTLMEFFNAKVFYELDQEIK